MPQRELLCSFIFLCEIDLLGSYELEHFGKNCLIFLVSNTHGIFVGIKLVEVDWEPPSRLIYNGIIKPKADGQILLVEFLRYQDLALLLKLHHEHLLGQLNLLKKKF